MENSFKIYISDGNNNWIRKDAGGLTRHLNELGKGVNDIGRGIRENVAPFRWMSEKLFPGYQEQMDKLREIDEEINRWTRDLDNVLDHAVDARKQGRFLDVFFWLNQINNRLRIANEKGKVLKEMTEEHLDEFFGKTQHGLQPDYLSKLKEDEILDPMEAFSSFVLDSMKEDLVKKAGFLSDIGDEITAYKMERMHRKRLEEMKRAITTLLSQAKNTVGNVYAKLADMSKARAEGNIGKYLQELSKISQIQENFENKVTNTFNSHGFKQMAERLKVKENHAKAQREKAEQAKAQQEKEINEKVEKAKEMAAARRNKSAPNTVSEPIPPTVDEPKAPITEQTPEVAPMPKTDPRGPAPQIFEPAKPELVTPEQKMKALQVPPAKVPPATPEVVDLTSPTSSGELEVDSKDLEKSHKSEKIDPLAQTIRSQTSLELEQIIIKRNHAHFFSELQKSAEATQDPYLLAAMILKYSESLDDIDPEKSLQLLAIAEGILE